MLDVEIMMVIKKEIALDLQSLPGGKKIITQINVQLHILINAVMEKAGSFIYKVLEFREGIPRK